LSLFESNRTDDRVAVGTIVSHFYLRTLHFSQTHLSLPHWSTDTTAREWWGKVACARTYAPRLCERARDFKTDVVRRLGSESIESLRDARSSSRESCGYVNIPGVRIDIHSTERERERTPRTPALARKLRAGIGFEYRR